MNPLFTLIGTVIQGRRRGKKLGFPTANFKVDPKTPQGIFISRVKIDGKIYNSLTFVGTAKTFAENDFAAETYILNFDQDIYGNTVKVFILKKIRNNIRFENKDELVAQMKKDKKEAIEFFQLH